MLHYSFCALKAIKFYLFFLYFLLIQANGFALDYYWVNGTGNWSDYSNHWATTSGGSNFHIQIPSPADDVFFDNNSGLASGVLAPNEIKPNRVQAMSTDLSKGFSHYYNKMDTGKKLTFKNLRKTYVSKLSLFMGGNAKSITGHSDDAVIEQHYKDKQVFVKAAQHFSVFTKEGERKNELENIRELNSQSKNKEIAK